MTTMIGFIPLLLSIVTFSTTTSANTTTTDLPDLPDPSFNYSELTKQPYFVDKTDLLRVLFEPPEPLPKYPVYFITCPPNFGKTVNQDMIKQFVQIQLDSSKNPIPPNETNAYNLFKNLSISQHSTIFPNHLARYPVLALDLLDIALLGMKIENILEELHFRIDDSINNFLGSDHLLEYFKKQGSVVDEDAEMSVVDFLEGLKSSSLQEQQMEFALYMLTKAYYEYFNKTKVVLLITKYDSTALNFYRNNKQSYVGHVYKLLNQILKRTFDLGKDLIQFALITSTSTLSYSLDNSMHDIIVHYPFLEEHRFTPYFGLTEDNLQNLLTTYKCEERETRIIKDYYRGYQTTGNRLIYNPYSITEYFKARKDNPNTPNLLQGYWKKAETAWKYIADFLKNQIFREKMGNLIQYREVQHPLRKTYDWNALFQLEQLRDRDYDESEDTHIDMYFTFYFELGLLGHTNVSDVFSIPNNEAQLAYEDILRHYHKPPTTTTIKSSNATSTSTTAGKSQFA